MKRFLIALIAFTLMGGLVFGGTVDDILEATGVKGGLVVQVGCKNRKLSSDLAKLEKFVFHGVDADPAKVRGTRYYLQEFGLLEKGTTDVFDGKNLPYIDNLVNLVVSEDLGEVSMKEVKRVLAPNGVAYIKKGEKWKKTVKPWPKEIDEWTHYLHDPQGTSVGKDEIVGLPRRMQWVGGPKWLRNHDFMSSLSGMVSSRGRIFYIIDEGLRNHIYLPGRWVVAARDAFNGTLLWKRPIEPWFAHTFPFKSGPGHLPRRIVSVGDRLYVTLGLTAPLSCLDAATGETIRTYEETKATEEAILSEGTLFVLADPEKNPFVYSHASDNRGKERDRVNEEFGWSRERPKRLVMAVDADSGKVLWQKRHHVASLTLAADGGKVYFHDGEKLVALERKNGELAWRSENFGAQPIPTTGYAPRLIVGKGVVVYSSKPAQRGQGRLVGVSSENGKILWKSDQPSSGHYSPEDLFLIGGDVWTANTGGSQVKRTHFVGLDALTGETRQDFVSEHIEAFFMHQRCYPGRATERYIMTSGTGTEFLELGTQKVELHHWLRGACIYGMMPSNGLLYRTPESCACFYQSKLAHFCALASEESVKSEGRRAKDGERLEKGTAYGDSSIHPSSFKLHPSEDWPTYRRDAKRSGHSKTRVPAEAGRLWRAKIGGRLSAMTAAGGKLFVSSVDRHTVHALDAESGRKKWSYLAGGRVDSPPTIHKGLALFGCADGWVYCLKADDGELAWRFRAAPGEDKLLSYQQVESVWPLHGSVLVRDGEVYCLAGRNMFLDGGMRLVRLEAATGKFLSETILDDKDPRTGENLQTLMAGKAVPVANPDILSFDGKNVYMRTQKFNLEGKRVDLDMVKGKEIDQLGEGRHLFCPTGFLDDMWFHRSYWIYGKNAGEGHGEYAKPMTATQTGRIMVFDDSRVFSFFPHNVGNNINPRTYYSVYAMDKELSPVKPAAAGASQADRKGKKKKVKTVNLPSKSKVRNIWELDRPGLLANAMVLAGDNLFLAGPPDVANEEKTRGYVFGEEREIHREMERQEKAWLGEEGALLWTVSAKDGAKLAERKIEALPVWDGMIAARGKLYLALKNGNVICLGEK